MKNTILTLGLLAAFAGTTTSAHAAGDRTMNISVNPLGMAFGAVNANVDFKLSDRFTLGPSVAFTSVSSGGTSATGISLGANANLYLSNKAFQDSWILSAGADYASASAGSLSASGLSIGSTIGYGWFWDSGFNIGLGAGIQYISLDYTKLGLTSISGVLPRISFTLGYAF